MHPLCAVLFDPSIMLKITGDPLINTLNSLASNVVKFANSLPISLRIFNEKSSRLVIVQLMIRSSHIGRIEGL
jgi:hypothetical protein